MLRLFFILLISLSSLFLSAQNRPPFRVVFWNTENFFDTRHDSLKTIWNFCPIQCVTGTTDDIKRN